jgi:hypothetical protein
MYVDAMTSMTPESAGQLLNVAVHDPDRAMSEATVVMFIDHAAAQIQSVARYSEWLDQHKRQFAHLEFASRRADEWRTAKDIEAGAPGSEYRLASASDWLQRKVAESSNSREAVAVLAEQGRTRRIRSIASERLATWTG